MARSTNFSSKPTAKVIAEHSEDSRALSEETMKAPTKHIIKGITKALNQYLTELGFPEVQAEYDKISGVLTFAQPKFRINPVGTFQLFVSGNLEEFIAEDEQFYTIEVFHLHPTRPTRSLAKRIILTRTDETNFTLREEIPWLK